MLAPLFRIEGRGTSSIPQRSLDFRLEPKVVGTIEGQGGQFEETGVRVPILVGGTWSDPTFRPDLTGLIQGTLEDPEAARQQVEGLIQGAAGRRRRHPARRRAARPAGRRRADRARAGGAGGAGVRAGRLDRGRARPGGGAGRRAANPAPQNLEEQLQEDPIGTLRGLFGN